MNRAEEPTRIDGREAALESIKAAVLNMDQQNRTRAMKFLDWYASGRIQIETGADRRGIRYDMESGQITVCILGEDDTEGIAAGFLGIEKRHWMDD